MKTNRHYPKLIPIAVCSLALLLLAATAHAAPTEGRTSWPLFRGPVAGGPELGDVIPDGDFGLAVEWQHALGSGYSNISVADGKAVTMFTDGDSDVLAAFDVATGKEVWRYLLGDKYVGHDGSTDGPLGTPTLAGDHVYALGPHGQLVAVSLADGSETWKHTLDESNSTVPFYGYTTAPVVKDELVIVATGGEGRTLTAYSRADGSQRWSVGDDSVTYQTPLVLELAGKQQVVAVNDRWLYGIDAANGKILWSHQHTEGNQTEQSAHATPVDSDTFLVKYNAGSKLYDVTDSGLQQVWESRAFANTLALPVYHDGHFYGFTGNFLSCADAKTGDVVWRSRPPGGLGVSLIDGHLAVVSPEGDLVLANASPAGYQEVTRLAALDVGDYAIPTFAEGRFYVRNLSQIASLRIDRSATPQVAEVSDADRLVGAFGQWAKEVEAMPASQRQAAVDEKFGATPGPQIGDGGEVTFLYRGAKEDVGLNGGTWAQGDGLYRLAGTDLHFRTYQLDPAGQYGYALAVDFGQPQADPGNPLAADMGFGPISELRMPGFDASPYIGAPADGVAKGRIDGFPFRSTALENSREIQVYRPAGYGDDAEKKFPLLVVNHGDNQVRAGDFQNTLDNMIAEGVIEPLLAVFVPRAAGPEYGGAQADDYDKFLVAELIPHVEAHYRTDGRRAIMGPGSAGVQAIYAAYHHPDVFQAAAAQSFYEIAPGVPKLREMIGTATAPGQLVIVYSKNDYNFPNGGQAEKTSTEMLGLLRDAGVDVQEIVGHYSPGWGGWRHQHDDILKALFPAKSGG